MRRGRASEGGLERKEKKTWEGMGREDVLLGLTFI